MRFKGTARLLCTLVIICACSCDGGEPTKPRDALFPTHYTDPAWSSQDQIAYRDEGIVCVYPTGAFTTDTSLAGIWLLNVSTGERTRIVSQGYAPTWSPNADSIACDLGGQIAVTGTSAPNPKIITSGSKDFFPSWSPVGGAIAFDSDRQSPTGNYTIWLIQSDGSNLRRVADSLVSGLRMPAWSPDGSKLAHIRYPGAGTYTSEIFIMNSDGTSPARLTNNNVDDLFPCFSPDGTKIAFARYDNQGIAQVWVMMSDGTQQVQVTTSGGTRPTWSGDSQRIAYVRETPLSNASGSGVLWAVTLSNGASQQLTSKRPNQCP